MAPLPLPRPPKSKRCTQCGGGGPFERSGRKNSPTWGSWCVKCKRTYNRAYGFGWRERNKKHWLKSLSAARLKRQLEKAREAYALNPTRLLANYIGRHTAPPGHRWCAYGQHHAKLSFFNKDKHQANGRYPTCRSCLRIARHAQKLGRLARKKVA